MSTWADVRRAALALPGVVEGTYHGTPAYYVKKKFLLRLKEDGQTIALRMGFEDRDVLMQADPEAFYITDHYRDYPALLVRLAGVGRERLRAVIEQGWRQVAPAPLQAEHDGTAKKTRKKK